MRAIWERYYSEANAVVFVIDAADPGRLQEAYEAYREVCSAPLLQNVPIVILANKQDLSGAASLQEIASVFFSKSAAGTSVVQHRLFGISALTGQGVREALETVCSEGKEHVQHQQAILGEVGEF
jgi:ADP-ribosylation factor related protein 1